MTNDEPNADELRSYDERDPAGATDLGEWADVPDDPTDWALGYETEQWERIPTTDDEQVIFLPSNDEDIEDNAFVVLDESDLCSTLTRR